MTVQTFQPALPAVVDLPGSLPAEMAAIVQWANTAEAARRLVEAIVDTPFMPQAFWPKFDPRDREAAERSRHIAIASGTAAVLYGGPLGLNPMQALANIHVVKGKPGLPAELMVALVRSHGHDVGVEDLTDTRCRVWGKRSGSEQVHRAEFTMDRARKAGYVAQNQKYNTDPQAMLYARAVSILCRQMAPEVLKGLPTAEELTDEPETGPDGAPAAGTRTVRPRAARPTVTVTATAQQTAQAAPRAAQRPAAGDEDDLLGYDQASAVPAAPPELGQESSDPITEPQLRKLGAVFGDLGVTGAGSRDRRLAIAAAVVGRDLASSKDLTKAEARTLIDTLEANGAHVIVDIEGQPASQGDEMGGADPDADADYDPTADPTWTGGEQ